MRVYMCVSIGVKPEVDSGSFLPSFPTLFIEADLPIRPRVCQHGLVYYSVGSGDPVSTFLLLELQTGHHAQLA